MTCGRRGLSRHGPLYGTSLTGSSSGKCSFCRTSSALYWSPLCWTCMTENGGPFSPPAGRGLGRKRSKGAYERSYWPLGCSLVGQLR